MSGAARVGGAWLVVWCLAQTGAAPTTVGVDFLATAADGTPIPDLTADQVTLRVDGKTRALLSLTFVSIPGRDAGEQGQEPIDPPFGSNVLLETEHPARAIVLVVEDESLPIGHERPMREAVAALVRSLSPRDRLAVFAAPRGGMRTDFTTDHDRVIRVFDQINGQASRNEDARCRTRDTLYALTALLENLEGSQHPVTVIVWSSGMAGPSPMSRAVTADGAPLLGTCLLQPDIFQQVGTAAERARANVYIVPPDTPPTGAMLEGIENLAGVTSARRLGMVGGADVALSRIVRETSGYYVATFAPEANERDGLSHRLDLRVNRPGVTIRSHAALPLAKAPGRVIGTMGLAATDLLRQPRMHRELPLRVAAFVSRKAAGQIGVVAIAEPAQTEVGLVSVAIGLYDSRNQLVAQWSARDDELGARPVQAGLVAPTGDYRLRAAAIDTFGRRGTADYALDGSLATAGSLQLSSLVLGLSRDGKFLPRLVFSREASMMAMVEVYGAAAGTQVGALLEVGPSANGTPLVTSRLVLEPTSEPDRYIGRGTIPLGALAPGDYVASVVIEAPGQPAGRVLRTFRKVSSSK